MTWVHRTLVVPAVIVESARNLGECMHPAARGMFTTPLSPTGEMPTTHYISAGCIEDIWLGVLADSALLYGAALQGAADQGLTLTATLADAEALAAQSDISDEWWETACARLGVTLISEPA